MDRCALEEGIAIPASADSKQVDHRHASTSWVGGRQARRWHGREKVLEAIRPRRAWIERTRTSRQAHVLWEPRQMRVLTLVKPNR